MDEFSSTTATPIHKNIQSSSTHSLFIEIEWLTIVVRVRLSELTGLLRSNASNVTSVSDIPGVLCQTCVDGFGSQVFVYFFILIAC